MKKKATATRKRRKRTAAAPTRRRRRSNRGMSEMFTSATAHAAARVVGAGALGGLAAGAVNRVLTKSSDVTRIGIEIGAAFITYAVLQYPNMSAGMAGAFAALESQPLYNKFLAEDDDDDVQFADEDAINEMPEFLNEDGDPLTLSEDEYGREVYLNENTGDVTLAETLYLNEDEDDSIYPAYSVQYS